MARKPRATSRDWALRARPHRRTPRSTTPRSRRETPKGLPPEPEYPGCPTRAARSGCLLQGGPLEVVGQDREGLPCPSKSLDTKRKIVIRVFPGCQTRVEPRGTRPRSRAGGPGSTTTTWALHLAEERVDLVAAREAQGGAPDQEVGHVGAQAPGERVEAASGPRPSRHSRSRPSRTAAALLLPPPRPPATGIRFVDA